WTSMAAPITPPRPSMMRALVKKIRMTYARRLSRLPMHHRLLHLLGAILHAAPLLIEFNGALVRGLGALDGLRELIQLLDETGDKHGDAHFFADAEGGGDVLDDQLRGHATAMTKIPLQHKLGEAAHRRKTHPRAGVDGGHHLGGVEP